jgi:hypothetical protein
MAIAQLRMDPVMERPTDQDLDAATGMVAPMDTVAGEMAGMERGVLDGDIPLIQLATHTRLARHLLYMCNPFWLSPLCWQHKPSPQSGIFVHPPRSIFRM